MAINKPASVRPSKDAAFTVTGGVSGAGLEGPALVPAPAAGAAAEMVVGSGMAAGALAAGADVGAAQPPPRSNTTRSRPTTLLVTRFTRASAVPCYPEQAVGHPGESER